jgi:hypothetical protein
MKKLLPYLLSLFLIATIISCKDKKQEGETKKGTGEEKKTTAKTSGSGEISITAPDGWSKADTSIRGYRTIMLMSEQEGPSDMFKENINVLTETVGTMNMDSYWDLTVNNMEKMLTNYKLKEVKEITVDGESAKSLDYSHEMQGYKIDVNAVVVIKGGKAYVITSSVEGGKLEKWRSAIDKTVASFHVD